jgi:hypothetical protein
VIIENLWKMRDAKTREMKTSQRADDAIGGIYNQVPIASGVTEDGIVRCAFELYCDRGREDGHGVDDWRTPNDNCVLPRVPRPPRRRADREGIPRSTSAGAASRRVSAKPGMKLRIEQVQRLCGASIRGANWFSTRRRR